MMAQQSKARTIRAMRLLAAVCLGLVLSVSLVHGHVSADATWRPQWIAWPNAQSAGPWHIQQKAIVEVEVEVRTESDAALLQSMGYSCGTGVCALELPDGEELALMELGLPVQIVARAIKVSGSTTGATAAETYEYGINTADVTIPDATAGGPGAVVRSHIDITTAPSGATVTRVTYGLLIQHSYVHDLMVGLGNLEKGASVWSQQGGTTDMGSDDDDADDNDIEIYSRQFLTELDDTDVNQEWHLSAQDRDDSNTGFIDSWHISVYYECIQLIPHTPSGPSPADGSSNQSLDVDLNWADAGHATEYDVYFGIAAPPPKVATTTSSSHTLETLFAGGSYKWMIVARNSCGETSGPLWTFQTCLRPSSPYSPTPTNGATNQSINVDLDWTDAYRATSYDVYFGTSASPPFVANTASSDYTLPPLSYNTHYYWKIVAKNSCGDEAGPVWDFTTEGAPAATPTATATPTRTPPGATPTPTRTPPGATPTPTRTQVCSAPGTPAGPIPASSATNQSIEIDLDWADAADATSYDVYFGTSASPPFLANIGSSSYALPTLGYSTTYYWKIVAKNSCGNTTGALWKFTTRQEGCTAPGTPSGPSPAGGAPNQPIDVDLDWADASGATSYDVYFGVCPSPPLHGNTTTSSYALPMLSYNAHYCWKIVAKNSCTESPSKVWDLNTEASGSFQQIHLPILLRGQ